MYHAHFGLTRGLFNDGIALDTAVYRSAQHDRLIANFKVALASPSSVVALTGPAGVGKTTLASTALRATSTRLAIAWLNGTPTNATELLELLLIELGIATVRTSRIERLQLWRQFQSEMSTTASRLFVVVERTEDLAPEVLRALDSLTSPDATGNPGANVVLLGQPGLERHLGAPTLDSLRQRIRLRAQLEPFTEAELQDYLRHQVACVGGHFDLIFAPGTVAALYRYSGGVARLANNLCETALTLAASQLEKPLSVATLTTAAVSLLGLVEQTPAVAGTETKPATLATKAPETAAPAAPKEPIVSAPPPSAARVEEKPTTRVAPAAAPPAPPPTPAVVATPPTVAVSAPAQVIEPEFDGGATDLSDVSISDFPILTDAVEMPQAARPAPVKPPVATPPTVPSAPAAARPAMGAAATPRAAAPPAAGPPAAPPPSPALTPTPNKRVETAYAVPKAAAPPKPVAPATAPAPKPTTTAPAAAPPAASKPAPPAPPKPGASSDEEDVLRQTQTMRAISVAKSIDDVSDSMAETLFGDAELDLLTAALASSAAWSESDPAEAPVAQPQANAPTASIAQSQPKAPAVKPAASADFDLIDLLGLGPDAPLELIDDSTLPPAAPRSKAATQR